MSYQQPQFNLRCSIWAEGNLPSVESPSYTNFPCQKYFDTRHTNRWYALNPFGDLPLVWVRMPRIVPFTGRIWEWGMSYFEVPEGSQQYYAAAWWDVAHEGFPNEYVAFRCFPCNSEGYAAWRGTIPGGFPPPVELDQVFIPPFYISP